jgi:hypothetical protein
MSAFDDMKPHEVVAVGRKIFGGKIYGGNGPWPTTARMRQNLVNMLERIADDEELKPATRMGAASLLMEAEKQNLVVIKMDIDAEGKFEMAEGRSGGPQIIMLIPPNFTEVSKVLDE